MCVCVCVCVKEKKKLLNQNSNGLPRDFVCCALFKQMSKRLTRVYSEEGGNST